MVKRSKKKRLQMQKKRPGVWEDAEIEDIVGSLDGDQMMAWVQSLAETGSYPCPACGTAVERVEHDHYRCSNPACLYEAYWSFGG